MRIESQDLFHIFITLKLLLFSKRRHSKDNKKTTFHTPLSLIPPIFLNNELSVPNILEMNPCMDLIMIGKKDPNSLNIPYLFFVCVCVCVCV